MKGETGQTASRPRVAAVHLHLTRYRAHPFPVECSCAHVAARAHCTHGTHPPRCTFRTVEHLHHSESMMSRSGAGIPTVCRGAHVEREAALAAIGPSVKSNVPTRGRGGATQRESASRCVPVRACAFT